MSASDLAISERRLQYKRDGFCAPRKDRSQDLWYPRPPSRESFFGIRRFGRSTCGCVWRHHRGNEARRNVQNPERLSSLKEDELWPAFSIHSNGSLPAPARFHLLPFRFTRLNGKELLVNEAGEFLFAPSGTVQRLADEQLDTNTELYQDLKAKHFVYDDSSSPLLDILATKVQDEV